MPKSLKFDLITENEEHQGCAGSVSVTLRTRNEANELMNADFLSSTSGEKWFFYSITIPPRANINVRGEKKPFIEASVNQQYYYFDSRLRYYKFEYIKHGYFIIEHAFKGQLHFHALINIGDEFQHNIEIELADVFLIKKQERKQNLVSNQVDDYFKAIAYFFKRPTQIVGYEDNEGFNNRIQKKQYEVSKYNLYHINCVEPLCVFDYGEYFNE